MEKTMSEQAYIQTKQQELLQEMNPNNYDTFITLGFPSESKRSPDAVTSVVMTWFKHLERKCYGRSAPNNKISRLITLEHSANGTHLHIALKKPNHKSHEDFKNIVRQKWQQLRTSGNQNMNNEKWYQAITDTNEDRLRINNYMTKDVNNYTTVLFDCM